MIIWIARHGQTELNRKNLMQGRTDAPLNEKGIAQAKQSRKNIGDVHFDAVYASPLKRAIVTGAIIGDVDPSEVIVDERIIETHFGKYEKRRYYALGLPMTAYWTLPRIGLRKRACRLPWGHHARAVRVSGRSAGRTSLGAHEEL